MKKKSILFISLIIILFQSGFPQKSNFHRDSLKQELPTASQEGKCELYIQLAHAYHNVNIDSIKVHAKKAVQIAELLDYTPLLAASYKELGSYYFFKDSLGLALSTFEVALDYYEKSKDKIYKIKKILK